MESRQLRALFVLSLVLGALLVVLNYSGPPEEDPLDERATLEVWELEREDVQRFTFTGRDQPEVVFERDDGTGWNIVAPEPGFADARAVDSALWDLVRNSHAVPVDGDPADFGLDNPRSVVTLIDKTDKAWVMKLGMDAPVGFQTYVLTPGGKIGAVDGQFGDVFSEGVERFRDRAALRYEVGDVVRASITSADGTVEVVKDERDWWLTGYAHADLDGVDDLLTGLLDLRYDQLMPPPSEGEIVEPRYTVEVELADGTLHRLQIGDRTPMGSFALTQGVTAGMIADNALALLAQGPPDLAEDHAFPAKPRLVSRVDVKLGETSWSLQREDDGPWKRDGAEEPLAEVALVEVAQASTHLRAEPVPALGEVWGTVTISEDVRVRTIDIGQREGSRWRVAQDRDGGGPYLIPVADLDAIAGAFEAKEE